jgi:hypothetical protein
MVMSRTVRVNPLLVLVSVLIGSSIGDWLGGYFGAFVAALLSIPCAAALQVIVRGLWRVTAPDAAPVGRDYEPTAASTSPEQPADASRPVRRDLPAFRRDSGSQYR